MAANPGSFQVIFMSNKKHVEDICKSANQKVEAFSLITRCLQTLNAEISYRTFMMSAFNCCQLIWIFCGKTANNGINRLHKCALRVKVLHGDYTSIFEQLLIKSEDLHCGNIRKLMVEIYECANSIRFTQSFDFVRIIHHQRN